MRSRISLGIRPPEDAWQGGTLGMAICGSFPGANWQTIEVFPEQEIRDPSSYLGLLPPELAIGGESVQHSVLGAHMSHGQICKGCPKRTWETSESPWLLWENLVSASCPWHMNHRLVTLTKPHLALRWRAPREFDLQEHGQDSSNVLWSRLPTGSHSDCDKSWAQQLERG